MDSRTQLVHPPATGFVASAADLGDAVERRAPMAMPRARVR